MRGLVQACFIVVLFCLLVVVIGLGRFGFDLWHHYHISKAASIALNFGGLWVALIFVGMGGLFFCLAFLLAYQARRGDVVDFYSRRNQAITGPGYSSVQQWLTVQSDEARCDFGLRALENINKGIWK